MSGDGSSALGAGLLGLIVGAALNNRQAPQQEVSEFEAEMNNRWGHLEYMDVTYPVEYVDTISTAGQIYAEAVGTYLIGYPNASVPTSFRCLEIGLKGKYEEVEGEEPSNDKSAYDLIEHFDDELGESILNLHWFRKQRNKIHSQNLIGEQDALEALRHITNALNSLYPFSTGTIFGVKQCCGREYQIPIERDQLFLGNRLRINCDMCNQVTEHYVVPR